MQAAPVCRESGPCITAAESLERFKNDLELRVALSDG